MGRKFDKGKKSKFAMLTDEEYWKVMISMGIGISKEEYLSLTKKEATNKI